MTRKILLLTFLASLLGACGGVDTAWLTIKVSNIPEDTQSVMVQTDYDDSCYLLPKRFSPQAARNLVFPRRCFARFKNYSLLVFTYDQNCCVYTEVSVSFAGDPDPSERGLEDLTVLAPLHDSLSTNCKRGAICGPE